MSVRRVLAVEDRAVHLIAPLAASADGLVHWSQRPNLADCGAPVTSPPPTSAVWPTCTLCARLRHRLSQHHATLVRSTLLADAACSLCGGAPHNHAHTAHPPQ